MKRKILLLEPNYKNKYPPIGLMKISTYHRLLSDYVTFYKGDLNDFIINQAKEMCISKLYRIDNTIEWKKYSDDIKNFIKTKKFDYLDNLNISGLKYEFLIYQSLVYYSDYFRKKVYKCYPEWDRVYVATLFTFYWNTTINTINFAKNLVKSNKDVFVGGVMASLIPEMIEKETGIKPIVGLLNKKGMLDEGAIFNIDKLPLDYSILDEIEYKYPTNSSYFCFMTKGCTRKCPFCSVPVIEPKYVPILKIQNSLKEVKNQFGDQKDLLLLDNNVLASPKFDKIIDDIIALGFYKGSTYIEPNFYEICINNLKLGYNDKAFIKKTVKILNVFRKKLKDNTAQEFYDILDKFELLTIETAMKESIFSSYKLISPIFEKYRVKVPKKRYVDFNQGVDCRYIDEKKMKLLSKIPIRPLRIAFDHISIKDKYIKAIRLAAKYKIRELSNYILYNYLDEPDALYERLKINIQLGEELGIHIYSFPMKYVPTYGEESKKREFIGKHWNRKYIRAIQSILNVTKGIVAPGKSFFEKAFGNDIEEYHKILLMPETYIVYRYIFEDNGYTREWEQQLYSLNKFEREYALEIIKSNDFSNIEYFGLTNKVLQFLRHYTIKRKDVEADKTYKSLKQKYNKLIRDNKFVNLSLTLDYEEYTEKNTG